MNFTFGDPDLQSDSTYCSTGIWYHFSLQTTNSLEFKPC